jgi:hypothetical protein
MSGRLVRITRSLSFDDLATGKVQPLSVYESLVEDWLLKPAEKMAEAYPEETDHGMALLAIELMFFEPHGQFLSGQSSKRKSKSTFVLAFDRFRTFLEAKKAVGNDTRNLSSELIYEWARCGLFHSGVMSSELLVDAYSFGAYCLNVNPILGGWLVNPWLLLPELRLYLQSYVNELRQYDIGKNELKLNFDETFNRMIKEPMRKFAR